MTGLRLVPGTISVLDADLSGDRAALARLLEVETIVEWPPIGGEHDKSAIEHFRSSLAADAGLVDWLVFYVCSGPLLVGSAGFFGRPLDGVAEIGYSICEGHRGRGFATAAVSALVDRAVDGGVQKLTAHVEPTNAASIAVLARNGFARTSLQPDGRLVFVRELGPGATAAS